MSVGKTQQNRSILSFFRGTPRAIQRDVLLSIEKQWEDADVFVIEAPTASGKSRLMSCVARWAASKKMKSIVVVPNNILLAQMEQTEKLFTLKGKDSYTCTLLKKHSQGESQQSCKERHAIAKEHCAGCPYISAVRRSHSSPFVLANYHTMMAHKLHKEVVLVDEAHLLLPLIVELESKHVWLPIGEDNRSLLPHSINTYGKLRDYVLSHTEELKGKVWDTLRKELSDGGERYLIKRGDKDYHSMQREALSLIPVDTSHCQSSAMLFPAKKVKKILLLSGTINKVDVEQMGFAGKRVTYIRCKSPISVERRPIVRSYLESPVTFAKCGEALFVKSMANRIVELVHRQDDESPSNILVHAPYALANLLKPSLLAALGERLMVHDKRSKRAQTALFTESVIKEEGTSVEGGGKDLPDRAVECTQRILLASGMEEGLDLAGTQFALQIICKVPFQSLAEPGWKWVAETTPDRYMWEALKKVVQATGRICRGPEDYGKTYILDSSLERCLQSSLVPDYFSEALVN